MALPVISEELFISASESINTDDTSALYEEMFKQQPYFRYLFLALSNTSLDFKEGYSKAMLQVWHLLNEQSILDEFK